VPDRPASTYRLQLHPDFGFADAAGTADYLAALGVTHAYLSPILQAAPGSRHGYDVVDHSRISAELGGEAGFRAMAGQFAGRGIGLVVDVVPNHMGIPVPEYLNKQLWSVLARGKHSPYAHWFDIDWAALDDQMLLPLLARPLRDCLNELTVTTPTGMPGNKRRMLRYQDHVLPLRPGTDRLPMTELLAAQWYRLDCWRSAASELNWRRFLDISSLIAIRVEAPDVFAATHGLLLGLVAEGLIAGLRIDHPDGLADPREYLRMLAMRTGGRWVVAEKILASAEALPEDWKCAGTTGYDCLAAVGELFTDPAGIPPLTRTYLRFTGGASEQDAAADFAAAARAARREIAGQSLSAEVARLARLLGRLGEPVIDAVPPADLHAILAELLAALGVYRAYVVPGEPPPHRSEAQVGAAAAQARRRLPGGLHAAVDLIAALLLGRGIDPGRPGQRDELIVRFQQTCAAVQAKGVEDTAAYRWTRLVSANEVGADPDYPARTTEDFHRFARRLSENWPATMTTLSTHDTKRQEDVRARLAVLAELPETWEREVTGWHERAAELARSGLPDPPTEYLLWQTMVGAWPIEADRLTEYMRKAMREAKLTTSWSEPDTRYESGVISFARLALADSEIAGRVAAFVAWIDPDARANSLGAKLVQLTMPGVPDVYQGCEMLGLSLVDPDNRRPVDFARRRAALAELDVADGRPDLADPDTAKLVVTSRALRLRRDHPDWFAADYLPLQAVGPAAGHAVAFSRARQVITVATRLPSGLRWGGGWQDTVLVLPPGLWRDVLTGAEYAIANHDAANPGVTNLGAANHGAANPGTGRVKLAELTARLPVALLVRDTAAG